MIHGSLFSGIGGFDLGFERAGIKTIWQVEIDAYCRRVLARHFPEAKRYDDIRTVGKHNLEPVDIISGGFPCQDISNAGKRAGIDGERSGLWSEYARIIRELRPRYVVVENVAALLHRGMERVLGDLAACGYDAEWQSIRASDVGAPHRRERIWIVAYPGCQHIDIQQPLQRIFEPARSGKDVASQPERSDWWAVEPDVCGMVDGLSPKLDGGLNASIGMGFQKDSEEVFEGILREMWEEIVSRSASSGPRSDEQLTRELADALRCLPHERALGEGEETLATAFGYLHRLRSSCEAIGIVRDPSESLVAAWLPASSETKDWAHLAACRGPWFSEWPEVGRVAKGIKDRVNRLRGLGNAIVPQIAEYIGWKIKNAS